MTRFTHLILCTGLVLLAVAALAGPPEEFRPSPPFTGTALPVPPRQAADWTAPETKMPAAVISATATLFSQGLADPRGCEYRAVEVGTGSCWNGDAGIVRAHGWVLPGDGTGGRFAICWNGLVYPAVSVGEKADLAADVQAAITADEALRAEQKRKNPDFPFFRSRNATPEGMSVDADAMLQLKVCLLLRLGEGELAQRFWTAWTAGDPINIAANDLNRQGPYLLLATDWAWVRFDRAVCALMRGDDRLAFLDAQALTAQQPLIEAEAAKRGFARPYVEENNKRVENAPYLQFLSPLPALLADTERRVKETGPAFSLKAVLAEQDPAKRVAGLIAALDEVNERQDGQPGWVTLGMDLLVEELIKAGEPAVEPLLACLETDTRLTRAVSFGRDFHMGRNLILVRSAAYVALQGILKTNDFGIPMPADPKVMAAHIRAYWEKNKDVSTEERWYRTLADDTATPQQWLEAAGQIMQPANETRVPGSMWVQTRPLKPGERPRARGEALRTKTNPSVSELLTKRIDQLMPADTSTLRDTRPFSQAYELATYLAHWDPPAAPPVLKTLQERGRHYLDSVSKNYPPYINQLGQQLARLALLRAEAGDKTGLDDYAAWLKDVTPVKNGERTTALLEPLWRFPEHPSLRDAANALFLEEKSPWRAALLEGADQEIQKLYNSYLLGLPAFRQCLLTVLREKREVGTIKVRPDRHSVDIRWANGGGYGYQVNSNDPTLPPAEKSLPVRVCDFAAWHLAKLAGFPALELHWPVATRDKAVAATTAYLTQYSARYVYNPALPRDEYRPSWESEQARFSLPALAQPATAADVKQGRAIFSLPDGAARRVVTLAFPQTATWTTLKKYPREEQVYNDATKQYDTRTVYDQRVQVWQAEEQQQADGTWKRYYGVVALHELARVPAEEIEFQLGERWEWGQLTHGLDCHLSLPEGASYSPGVPKTLQVTLRNRRGVAQTVPNELFRPAGNGGPALRAGVTLRCTYTPRLPGERGGRPAPPIELPTRITAHFTPDAGKKLLAPTEAFAAFTFSPAAWFDFSKPGMYFLALEFTNASGIAEGKSNGVTIVVDATAGK